MTAVQGMGFCRWEGQTLPTGHLCAGDAAVACAAPLEGQVCGTCTPFLSAQAADVARWGTPGDLADAAAHAGGWV